MTEFETSALMAIDVSQQSLREARATIEDDLGDIEVDVSATASDDASASRDHQPRMSADGGFDEMQVLAVQRNELLSDIADELEAGNITKTKGGGSSGLLTGGLLALKGGSIASTVGSTLGGVGGAVGGLKGGASSALLSGAMTPGSPLFFGQGGTWQEDKQMGVEKNAEQFGNLMDDLGSIGPLFPGLDENIGNAVSKLENIDFPDPPDLSGIESTFKDLKFPDVPNLNPFDDGGGSDEGTADVPENTPVGQSDAADLLNPYRKKVTQDGVEGRNQAGNMLNQYRQRVTQEGVEGRTQATNMLNSYRTADSKGNRAADSKRQQSSEVTFSPTYQLDTRELERMQRRGMDELERRIEQLERGFGGR